MKISKRLLFYIAYCRTSSLASNSSIKDYHCGKVGKSRIVTIKDGQNHVLKEFHFPHVKTPTGEIALYIKDVHKLKKDSSPLKIFYSSSELPNRRLLALVVI